MDNQFCDDCGWLRPIVHRFVERKDKRVIEVRLCAKCKDHREQRAMPLDETSAQAHGHTDASPSKLVPKPKRKGLSHASRLYLVMGLLLGIVVGVSIGYNLLKVWFPCT